MVEIIKMGVVPGDRVHKTTCRNCRTHFSFKEADTDEPQELKAKSPLLARAFRSSVG